MDYGLDVVTRPKQTRETKEVLISRLNHALEMKNRLNHLQFQQIRLWELREMVRKIQSLREQAERSSMVVAE